MICEGCGAPVSGEKCSYCDRRLTASLPVKRLMRSDRGVHGTLDNVRLEGDGNIIRMARLCEIIGNRNVILVAEGCTVHGKNNIVKEERP